MPAHGWWPRPRCATRARARARLDQITGWIGEMLSEPYGERPPPHDIGAEQRVLGSLMVTPDATVPAALGLLTGSSFYRAAHRLIWDAVIDLYDRHAPCDPVAVFDRLGRDGLRAGIDGPYLHTLIQDAPIAAQLGHYAGIVARHARERTRLELAAALAAEGADLAAIAARLGDLARDEVAGRNLILTPASKIPIRPVRWLWDTTPPDAPPTSHGRIPMSSLAMCAGGPGMGKSQFAAWMAARVTTGTLPGQLHGRPRAVIYAATEDSWSYTIAPRLMVAGADLDMVFRVDVRDDGARHARLTLPTDTALLGETAGRHSVALMVADPLLSLIDKGVNDYRAAEVRQALEPLVAAADQHHFTILGLAHFTKSGAADPLARLAGSGAFGQLIRSMIAFAKRENEDGDPEFVMSLEKNNLGRLELPSHTYTIQSCTVDTDEGPSFVSRFVIGAETTGSVRDAMREDNLPDSSRAETSETVMWLRGHLTDAGGTDDARDIRKCARKDGISDSALYRARTKLGVTAQSSGFGKDRRSFWSLPGTLPAAATAEAGGF